jgi:hypothetical protein
MSSEGMGGGGGGGGGRGGESVEENVEQKKNLQWTFDPSRQCYYVPQMLGKKHSVTEYNIPEE